PDLGGAARDVLDTMGHRGVSVRSGGEATRDRRVWWSLGLTEGLQDQRGAGEIHRNAIMRMRVEERALPGREHDVDDLDCLVPELHVMPWFLLDRNGSGLAREHRQRAGQEEALDHPGHSEPPSLAPRSSARASARRALR